MRLMHDKTLYFADGSFVLSASGDVDDVTESTDVIEGLGKLLTSELIYLSHSNFRRSMTRRRHKQQGYFDIFSCSPVFTL